MALKFLGYLAGISLVVLPGFMEVSSFRNMYLAGTTLINKYYKMFSIDVHRCWL